MRRLTLIAAAAAILATGPALAQEAAPAVAALPQAAPATPAAEEAPQPLSAEETALEASSEQFKGRVQAMATEMRTAIAAAAGDATKADADLDAIVARYQPEVDAFAAEVEAFIVAQSAVAPEAERAGMADGASTAVVQIKALPTLVRTQLQAEPAAPAQAPAQAPIQAPAAPATPE